MYFLSLPLRANRSSMSYVYLLLAVIIIICVMLVEKAECKSTLMSHKNKRFLVSRLAATLEN
jgi:hypothetical protein